MGTTTKLGAISRGVKILRNRSYTGRNFYYGIREHAMGSILNGISYFGLHRCSGSTFLVFADYMRAPMRVAALSELPVNYILTHDSIGVGEVRGSQRWWGMGGCWFRTVGRYIHGCSRLD